MAFGCHPAAGQHAFAHVFIHRVLGHLIKCFVITIALENGNRPIGIGQIAIALWRVKYRNLRTQRSQNIHCRIIVFQHLCVTDLPFTVVKNTQFQPLNTGAMKGKQTVAVLQVLIYGPTLGAAQNREHQCDICDRACHWARGVQCM